MPTREAYWQLQHTVSTPALHKLGAFATEVRCIRQQFNPASQADCGHVRVYRDDSVQLPALTIVYTSCNICVRTPDHNEKWASNICFRVSLAVSRVSKTAGFKASYAIRGA